MWSAGWQPALRVFIQRVARGVPVEGPFLRPERRGPLTVEGITLIRFHLDGACAPFPLGGRRRPA